MVFVRINDPAELLVIIAELTNSLLGKTLERHYLKSTF